MNFFILPDLLDLTRSFTCTTLQDKLNLEKKFKYCLQVFMRKKKNSTQKVVGLKKLKTIFKK